MESLIEQKEGVLRKGKDYCGRYDWTGRHILSETKKWEVEEWEE